MPAAPDSWIDVVLDTWRAGQRASIVGPGPVDAHLEHARALAQQLETPRVAVDLGSGAGIPGLALAGLWPDSEWLLIDAAARRVRMLLAAVDELQWSDRVTVLHDRAEVAARNPLWRGVADLVTARLFGPPAATAECGAGFLRHGGLLVVTEPPDTPSDRWPLDGLAQLQLTSLISPADDTVRIQRLERRGDLADSIPRRAGVPAKRPLF